MMPRPRLCWSFVVQTQMQAPVVICFFRVFCELPDMVKGNKPLTQQKFIFQDSINTLGDSIFVDMVFFRPLALYPLQTCQPIPGQDTNPTLTLPSPFHGFFLIRD